MLRTVLVVAAVAALVLVACDADEEPLEPVGPAALCTTQLTPADHSGAPEGCDLYVEPGDDDQGAVQGALIEAWPGSTVCLAAGTYTLDMELTLRTPDVTVRGAGIDETILDFAAQDIGANGLAITSDRVIVEKLQVLDSAGDGIRATGVNGIVFREVAVIWSADESDQNGAYGLYPVSADGVLIEKCRVKGSSDAGVYVGQSRNIVVRENEVFGNVAGIEIENSLDAEVYDNHTYDNTAGILVFNLPGLPMKGGERANVHDNLVEHNNTKNFAGGGIVRQVPAGIGMLILACDGNEFHSNTITGHDSAGIVVVTYLEDLFGSFNDDEYEIHSSDNWIHDNTFEGNGASPRGLLSVLIPEDRQLDIIVDGCADAPDPWHQNNCMSDNGAATFGNLDLCSGADSQPTFDIGPVTCTGEALPATTVTVTQQAGDPPTDPVPCATLSSHNLFERPFAKLVPNERVYPYEVASPLWSDNAGKSRFIYVPEGKTVTLQADGTLDFPEGAIVIKTFWFSPDMRDPDVGRRLVETRLLIREGDTWRPENYVWNDDQTDAEQWAGGRRVPVSYTDRDGDAIETDYLVPTRDQCASCHESGGEMRLLGPIAGQLNHTATPDGSNRLQTLADAGIFSEALPALDTLPAFPPPDSSADLDTRARAYLHANCSHCHREGGAAGSTGLHLSFDQTDPTRLGICKVPAAAGQGAGGLQYDVVPGDPDNSIMVYRMSSTDPDIKMPELPNRLVDRHGLQMIRDWIAQMEPAGCGSTP